MKIVTVNVHEKDIETIERLIGENGMYPSRSELIRCAVREFLIKELSKIRNLKKKEKQKIDDEVNGLIRIPLENGDSKIYKVIGEA